MSVIDEQPFFWTGQIGISKLWSPGHWDLKAIRTAGLNDLEKVKWAFNAKPDLLVISNGSVLMIEAKLESGEGRDGGSGYRQLEVQEQVAHLLKVLVPQFHTSDFHNMVLTVKPTGSGITWREILDIIGRNEVDAFTQECLGQLQRFYQ